VRERERERERECVCERERQRERVRETVITNGMLQRRLVEMQMRDTSNR